VNPRLTVILPHYDCARHLGRAVASVLRQDFTDLRLVVVDDCSPNEDWVPVLRAFADDPRLAVFTTSRNVGHLRIKNAVLADLRSPYVGFQDADDESLPERFGRQVRALDRGRADIVGCAVEYVDDAGTPLRSRRFGRNGNLWLRLGRSFVTLHPATTVRREVLERIGGFDGTARVAADSDFHLRAAYLYRIRNLRTVLYRYCQRADSLTLAPETGFTSGLRQEYTKGMWEREQARRQARSTPALLPLLTAPGNDVEFSLRPFPPGPVTR
jgi:glycosyltransferase involved in cell wall biosynthesis